VRRGCRGDAAVTDGRAEAAPQDRRFADHTSLMLELLDEWITRAREINELRTRNGRRSQQQPRDYTEQVAAFEQRLVELRNLLVQ
jgi:hypothetical protein